MKDVIAKADEFGMPAAQQLQGLPKELADALFPDLITHGLAGLMEDWVDDFVAHLIKTAESLSYVTIDEKRRMKLAIKEWEAEHDPNRNRTLVKPNKHYSHFKKEGLSEEDTLLATDMASLLLIYPYHAITKRMVPKAKWIKPSPAYLNLISEVPNSVRTTLPAAVKLEWLEAQKEVKRNPDINQPNYYRKF